MKKTIAAISHSLQLGACSMDSGGLPAAEIDSMSGDQISVVYYDSVSGPGSAGQMANAYCDPQTAVPSGRSDGGNMPDKVVITYQCKTIEK